MAGIGFELKKLFVHKGILESIKAYGFAGIVCTGPMLLGILLLLVVRYIATLGGASVVEQDTLVAILTHTLIASLTISSILLMVVTRFTADMLYINKPEKILPSFYGSSAILLIIGSIGYGIFLILTNAPLAYKALCYILFCVLIVVWLQVSYITALKDYRRILLWFIIGVVVSILSGFLFIILKIDTICALLSALIIGYGTIMSGFFILMHRCFPKGQGSSFFFLNWIDRYPSLLFMGLFMSIGVFSHLVIAWFGPYGRQVFDLFHDAPQYDVPAFIAFLSVIPTTIGFVTSCEVNFYPKYKHYFFLYNNGGTLKDIEIAELEMIQVLRKEIYYLAQKQFITTMLFIIIGGYLLLPSSMIMDETSLSIYRILCIGYGLYAIANSLFLILLYFADNKGALLTSLTFMITCIISTITLSYVNNNYLGFGFLIGSLLMYLVSWIRMRYYLNSLQYHILCAQPIVVKETRGMFTVMNEMIERRMGEIEKGHVKQTRGNIKRTKIQHKVTKQID
jgi:polysaccharide biosynthesis protein PelG